MVKKSRAFTLFELLLAITLIGLIFSCVGIQLPKAMRAECYEQEVQRMIGKIELAAAIAHEWDCDIALEFRTNAEKLDCIFYVDAAPCRLQKELARRCSFQEIHHVYLNDHAISSLYFHTRSGSPQGILTLIGNDKKVDFTLTGFPGKIKQGRHRVREEIAYPQEILSFA